MEPRGVIVAKVTDMKTILLLTLATLGMHAQPLQQSERDRAMSHMHATRKVFLDSLSGVSKAQWDFKPAPEVWSIAECAEHIVLSEDLIFNLATKQVMAAPMDPALKVDKANDEKVLAAMVNRSVKAQAPEPLKPQRIFATPEAAIVEFKKRRDRNIAYVQTTQDELRAHAVKHPIFGALDAYQWLLLLSAHSERHTLQLNEVKMSTGYPK